MYVCLCSGITDHDIRQAIQSGAGSLPALREGLGVGLQCGRCVATVCGLLAEAAASPAGRVEDARVAEPA